MQFNKNKCDKLLLTMTRTMIRTITRAITLVMAMSVMIACSQNNGFNAVNPEYSAHTESTHSDEYLNQMLGNEVTAIQKQQIKQLTSMAMDIVDFSKLFNTMMAEENALNMHREDSQIDELNGKDNLDVKENNDEYQCLRQYLTSQQGAIEFQHIKSAGYVLSKSEKEVNQALAMLTPEMLALLKQMADNNANQGNWGSVAGAKAYLSAQSDKMLVYQPLSILLADEQYADLRKALNFDSQYGKTLDMFLHQYMFFAAAGCV